MFTFKVVFHTSLSITSSTSATATRVAFGPTHSSPPEDVDYSAVFDHFSLVTVRVCRLIPSPCTGPPAEVHMEFYLTFCCSVLKCAREILVHLCE